MNTQSFQNKICWITGASSGIGAALSFLLNKNGAFLILSSRNKSNLDQVKASCLHPDRVMVLPIDLENSATLVFEAEQAWKLFGRIDYVFLNGGMAVRDLIDDTGMDMIHKVMNINFYGNVEITKALLPWMKKKGRGCFIVTSSLCGKFGVPKLGAYSASKHALHGFFESLRAENQNNGIQVTIITAGLVNTSITLNALNGNGSVYGKMQESIATGISANDCARRIIRAVSKGKSEVLIGGPEIIGVFINRFFPRLLRLVITRHPVQKLRNLGFLPSNKTKLLQV